MIKFIYKNGRLEMYDPDFKDNPNRVNPPDDDDLFEAEMQPSHLKIVETIEDPLILWEALSYDGFIPPFSNDSRGFFEQRQNIIAQEHLESSLMQAVADKDFKALGEIMFDQICGYAESVIDFRERR